MDIFQMFSSGNLIYLSSLSESLYTSRRKCCGSPPSNPGSQDTSAAPLVKLLRVQLPTGCGLPIEYEKITQVRTSAAVTASVF